MHPEAFEFVSKAVYKHGPFRRVVEIGGRDVNGSVRPLFGDAIYTSVDIEDGAGVDVVADAAWWMPTDAGMVECVVCCEVLEHVEHADRLLAAAGLWLRNGGVLIMTCATDPRAPHSAIDGFDLRPGEFYRNVIERELESWLCVFAEVRIATHPRGDLYCVARR